MKTELHDFLKLNELTDSSYNDMVNASVKNMDSNNTLLAFRFARTNCISVFIAIVLFCSLKMTETATEIFRLQSSMDLTAVGELINTNNIYHISFVLITFFFLILNTIANSCIVKNKMEENNNSLDFNTIFDLLFLFFTALFFIGVFILTFLEKEPSNIYVINLSFYCLLSLVLYSAYSIFIYFKVKKFSGFDKNAESIFQNKLNKYRTLNEQINKERNEIIKDKNSILEIYEALESDSLDERQLDSLKTILNEISRINKEKNQKKIDAEKEKNQYKKDIKEYLDIENTEKSFIIND